MTDPKKQMNALLWLLSKGSWLGMVLMIAYVLGPITEAAYFPVVTDVKVYETVSTHPDRVALVLFANKQRDCEIVDLVGLSGDAFAPEKSRIFFPNDGDGKSRPTGYQSFGVWEFAPEGDYVKVVVRHKCFMPWTLTTEMFEWKR